MFTAWFVLLAVQASLVGLGRTDLHRRLGTAGALLAVAMVVTGTAGALIAARRPGAFMEGGSPAFFGITDLFLVPLVVWDLATRRRLHPATTWADLALVASQPLRLWVSGTAGWMAFARWATGLGG